MGWSDWSRLLRPRLMYRERRTAGLPPGREGAANSRHGTRQVGLVDRRVGPVRGHGAAIYDAFRPVRRGVCTLRYQGCRYVHALPIWALPPVPDRPRAQTPAHTAFSSRDNATVCDQVSPSGFDSARNRRRSCPIATESSVTAVSRDLDVPGKALMCFN